MLQFSNTIRNACVQARHDQVGSGAKLQIYGGAAPASCATAATGTKLAEISLPYPFMVANGAGVFQLTGSWTTTGIAAGNATHFRLIDAGGVCHHQGSVSSTTGDMVLDYTAIGVGQSVSVTAYTFTEGGA